MENAKVKETLNEFALRQWKAKAGRREEDHIPLVQYNSRGSALYVPERNSRYCGLSGCNACIILLVFLGLVIGLPVGLTMKHKHSNDQSEQSDQSDHGDKHEGSMTPYDPSQSTSACGSTYSIFDNVTMISPTLFDTDLTAENRTVSPYCGHKLQAQRENRTIILTVVDSCDGGVYGCIGSFDLVVSVGAFEVLADPKQDEVDVLWYWLPPYVST